MYTEEPINLSVLVKITQIQDKKTNTGTTDKPKAFYLQTFVMYLSNPCINIIFITNSVIQNLFRIKDGEIFRTHLKLSIS